MSYTPLPNTAKPAWAKQLTQLPCFVAYANFQSRQLLSRGQTSLLLLKMCTSPMSTPMLNLNNFLD